MASRQVLYGVGAVGLAGASYYLYTAGGSPKLAEKNAEYDAAKLRSRMSGSASAQANEAQKGIEASAQQVGSSVDYAIQQAKNEGKYYQNQVQEFGKTVEHKVTDAVEQAKAQAKDYQKELQNFGRTAEQKLEETYEQAKARAAEAANQLQGYQSEAERKLAEARKETGNQMLKAVDSFDKSVDQGAAKTKGGIMSWFGGGK